MDTFNHQNMNNMNDFNFNGTNLSDIPNLPMNNNNQNQNQNQKVNQVLNNYYAKDTMSIKSDIDLDEYIFNDAPLDNLTLNTKYSTRSKKSKKLLDLDDLDSEIDMPKKDSSKKSKESKGYLEWFFNDCFNYKDFILLFALYFILSQEMIKDFFGGYFTSINPDDEGKVGVQGVLIYGLILCVLFAIIKKFI